MNANIGVDLRIWDLSLSGRGWNLVSRLKIIPTIHSAALVAAAFPSDSQLIFNRMDVDPTGMIQSLSLLQALMFLFIGSDRDKDGDCTRSASRTFLSRAPPPMQSFFVLSVCDRCSCLYFVIDHPIHSFISAGHPFVCCSSLIYPFNPLAAVDRLIFGYFLCYSQFSRCTICFVTVSFGWQFSITACYRRYSVTYWILVVLILFSFCTLCRFLVCFFCPRSHYLFCIVLTSCSSSSVASRYSSPTSFLLHSHAAFSLHPPFSSSSSPCCPRALSHAAIHSCYAAVSAQSSFVLFCFCFTSALLSLFSSLLFPVLCGAVRCCTVL